MPKEKNTPTDDKNQHKTTAAPMLFGEPNEDLDEEELDEVAEQVDEFDIFTDVGEKLTKAGDRITYTIKRNGEFLAGSVQHPYSWDQVQKKYGGGTFTIIARSTQRGGYVKTQSRNVAGPDLEEKQHAAQPSGSSITELLALMTQQRKDEQEAQRHRDEQAAEERRERERLRKEEEEKRLNAENNSTNTMMTMMMQMMKSQSEQTTALLAAVMGGKKEDIKLEKIMEMMDQRMEKTIQLLTGKEKKNEGIDPFKLIEMQATAEERGYKRAMDAVDLADKKAEELADMRERGGTQEKETTSTTKTLVDAVMPVVQTFMESRSPALQQAPAPQDPRAHARALPPPPVKPAPQNKGPAQAASVLGLGRPLPTPAQRKPQPMKDPKKTLIENTTIAEIGKDLSSNLLTGKYNPEGTADKVLELLKPHQIDAAALCSQYTLDDMIKAAAAKGIPDAIKPYLERFYAHIKAKTTVGTGSAAQGSEPANR